MSRLPIWMLKPKNTIYLQTWHGTPLKKLGIDIEEVQMPGTDTTQYKKNFVSESSKWDYLISQNNYATKIFQKAFQYNGQIIESGYPRNDYLFSYNNKSDIDCIKSKLNIPSGKRLFYM